MTLELREGFSTSDLLDRQRMVPFATQAKYLYEASSAAPVSRVFVVLLDSYRSVVVRGTNMNRVEAVLGAINEVISEHEKVIAGQSLRLWAGFFMMWAAVSAIVLPIIRVVRWLYAKEADPSVKLNWRVQVVWAGAGLLLCVLLLVVPWADLLPGAAIFAGSASFPERYAAQINLYGVLLGLLGPVLIYVVRRFLAREKAVLGGAVAQDRGSGNHLK
jgi:hypothetical protein